ncbi:MAG: FliH/SctL family protein [Sulfuritalea sp.]|jgi:flagellar assembly protein FliH|nr:FliH/SctL family protein [Sulfuritalea sp.]
MSMDEHPKSTLTAWERWELASFDSTVGSSVGTATEPGLPAVSDDEVHRIREKARLEGHQAGYAAGQAQAENMGREQALLLAETLRNLEQCIAEVNQAVANDLLALSIEVARQVVRQTVDVKPEVLLGVIREALEQLPLLHAAIHLHPEDASLARLRAGDQLAHAGHRIHEDPKLKRGDVVIEAGGSHLDASLATRWRRVVEALGQNASWVDLVER